MNQEQSVSKIIFPHFPELSPVQIARFEQLYQLYSDWNSKINLISRKEIDFLYARHVLHSLSIAKIIQFQAGTRILDVGTGGGFPGIPLAILFPETQFLLIDSIAKKIKVVDDVINQLKLTNAACKVCRAEDINEKFDFVVSRAVAAFPQLYEWVKDKINKKSFNALPNGIIVLKGGDLDAELSVFRGLVKSYELKSLFEDEFFETKKIIYMPRWDKL